MTHMIGHDRQMRQDIAVRFNGTSVCVQYVEAIRKAYDAQTGALCPLVSEEGFPT